MIAKRTALVIGATGLVGRQLVEQLIKDKTFERVKVFVRRPLGIDTPKLEEYLIDFNALDQIAVEITGDVLFSCLGTTLKQAGGQDAQYLVDYTYQYEFAKLAQANGVGHYILVSSASANSSSIFFYTKIKGQLEEAVQVLGFDRVSIVRPSLLIGQREQARKGEAISAVVLESLGKVFEKVRKYRSIQGVEVAKAMIHLTKVSSNTVIHQLDELHQLANLEDDAES